MPTREKAKYLEFCELLTQTKAFSGLHIEDTQTVLIVQITYLNTENTSIEASGPFWINVIDAESSLV